MKTLFLSAFGLIVLSLSSLAYAQTEQTMSVRLDPPIAQLQKKVHAILNNSTIDTSTSLVVWKLDGVVLSQGIGATETDFTLTNRGESTLEVTVVERDGIETKLIQKVTPSDVDILWEGISYTPPLYGGRPLVGPGGKITVTAIAHTSLGSPETLIYSWYQDGKLLTKQSGFGKNSAQMQMPVFGDNTLIRVDVKSLNNEYVGGNGVRIYPTPILVRMYHERSLVGLWTNTVVALTNALEGPVTLRAIPYYLDGLNLARARFEWASSTGQIAPDAEGKAMYTPRAQNGIVSVEVSHSSKLLQQASVKTRIGIPTESTLFGI